MGIDSEAMKFAKDSRKLEDPNVFIRDTGATCITINSKYGFKNIREATTNENIIGTLGSGIEENIVENLSGAI